MCSLPLRFDRNDGRLSRLQPFIDEVMLFGVAPLEWEAQGEVVNFARAAFDEANKGYLEVSRKHVTEHGC
jgi:hypothetical protein